MASPDTPESSHAGISVHQVPGHGDAPNEEIATVVMVSDAVLARFARTVLMPALRPLDRADELRAVVEPKPSSAHDPQPGYDLGMSEHVPERIAVRLFELQDVCSSQTQSPCSFELRVFRTRSAGLNLVFLMIESVVGGSELLPIEHIAGDEEPGQIPEVAFFRIHRFVSL